MFESALRWWCRQMHSNVMHPVNGKYICGECLREWPVPWSEKGTIERAALAPHHPSKFFSDVIITAPERGLMLIRLPIAHFRSALTSAPKETVIR